MISMYCIYENPMDFPGKFVVRLWHGTIPPMMAKDAHAVVDTLDEARKSIPFGRTPMKRHVNDDPCIVEVWL